MIYEKLNKTEVILLYIYIFLNFIYLFVYDYAYNLYNFE